MKHAMACFVMLCVLFALTGTAVSKSATLFVPLNQVHAYNGERGSFYVVNVSIPEDVAGKRLDTVFLEFAVDATPLVEDDSTVATPVVGAYPLTASYSGGLVGGVPGRNTEPAFTSIVPSSKPVAQGERRLVRFDITDTVKGWIENPQSNHGLVIGSLLGPEVATVTLNEAIPGGATPVRVTFFYQNRFGGKVSSGQ